MEEETNYGKTETFSVLNKIHELMKFSPEGDLLRYKIKFFGEHGHKKGINPLKEDEILYDFQKWGLLKMENEKELIDDERIYYLKILPKFKETYADHKNLIAQKEEFSKSKSVTDLYLNKSGDLWREPKKRYCYKMGVKSDRYKIIRYLVTNKGYQQTSNISSALEGKKEQSIRTEISKIRSNVKKFLKINGNQFIEAKKGSGYRIGTDYKVKIEKEK